jgi:hypothetical protein
VTETDEFPEEPLARLLGLLRPAPEAWVRVAQELAPALARAEVDAEFREALLADTGAALAADGYDVSPDLIPELRARLLQ